MIISYKLSEIRLEISEESQECLLQLKKVPYSLSAFYNSPRRKQQQLQLHAGWGQSTSTTRTIWIIKTVRGWEINTIQLKWAPEIGAKTSTFSIRDISIEWHIWSASGAQSGAEAKPNLLNCSRGLCNEIIPDLAKILKYLWILEFLYLVIYTMHFLFHRR